MSERVLNLAVWLALLALLALTVGLSFLPLGRWGLPVAATIAVAKALLIGGVYMEILRRGHLPRLAVVTLGFFLTVLFGMVLTLS